MLYCEFCKISKNTIFTEHLWTTSCEFITDILIFSSSCSQMIFKVSVLKNFAVLEPLSNNKPSFTEHLRWLLPNFCGSKYFFAAEYGIYCWQLHRFRSSHQRCSIRNGVLRNFAKLTGKQKCQSLFFNEVAGLRSATLLKKRLWHKGFSCEFCEISKSTFFREHLQTTASTSFCSGLLW